MTCHNTLLPSRLPFWDIESKFEATRNHKLKKCRKITKQQSNFAAKITLPNKALPLVDRQAAGEKGLHYLTCLKSTYFLRIRNTDIWTYEGRGKWDCGSLHNKELYALYSSPNIIRVIKSRRLRWAGHVASMGERRSAYRVVVEKPEGRRQRERPRHGWKDNSKMDLREVGWVHGLDRSGSG